MRIRLVVTNYKSLNGYKLTKLTKTKLMQAKTKLTKTKLTKTKLMQAKTKLTKTKLTD